MPDVRKDAHDLTHGLHVGDRVEVVTHFTGTWVTGFEVAAISADDYRIRRVSDGTVLPITFGQHEVRREQPTPDLVGHPVNERGTLLRETAHNASVVIRFPAELEIQTVERIAPAVMDQINHARGEVVLDLDAVEFLDTYGIRLLVQVRRCAWERDLPVRLHGGKPMVRALLDLLGVDPLFVPEPAPQTSGSHTA